MTPTEFSKALVQSAKALDVPAAGAKTRAVAHVAAAAGAAGAVGAGTAVAAVAGAAVVRSKLGVLAWSLAAAAAAVAGTGGFVLARATADRPPVTSPSPAALDPDVAPARPSREAPAPRPAAASASARAEAAAPAPNACTHPVIADVPPTTCSRRGKPVPFDIRNGCAGDVDVFWVDYACQEVFHHRLGNGESFPRVSQDGHVWRIRDHATHALIKEFSPQRVPGAADLSHEGPARVLPDVVLHAADASSAEETSPAVCSGAGVPSKFLVKNERDAQAVVMWVGLDCKEKYWERVEPGHSLPIKGRDGDAWRVRDARSGALLLDVVPDVPDTTTYITVP